MGNRAVIATTTMLEPKNSTETAIYLHYNGGRDSVEAFLQYCKLKGYRPPEVDNYGWARLCQVIGNFFGGSLSIGIDKCCNLDCNNGDNGTYIIKDWEIVGRKYAPWSEQHSHDMTDMLIAIDKAQPVKEQLGEEFFSTKEVSVEDLKLGDEVYVFDTIYNKYEKYTVIGIGGGERVNGIGRKDIPYVNKYADMDGNYATNPNNYIMHKTIRLCV